jgi:hypothetical protein
VSAVPLTTLYDLALAEIMRGRLEAEGLYAWTTGGATASLYGGATGISLWVSEDDAPLARELLELPTD